MQNLIIDIETRSGADLATSGVYKYAEDEDFKLLLIGYSVDFGKVQIAEEIPAEIAAALADDKVVKWAHNANFERVCLSKSLNMNGFLNPESWRCTMALAAYFGLPQSLKDVCEELRLSAKMDEGRDLIRLFCCKNRKGGFADPSENLQKWRIFKDYCRRDVECAVQLAGLFKRAKIYDNFWNEYAADQRINDRGVKIDLGFVTQAERIIAETDAQIMATLKAKTGLENPNSSAQFLQWLRERGVATDTVNKKDLAKMQLPPEVASIVKLRNSLASAAIKKYSAMRNYACMDGRARGMFKFFGGGKTGRWSSKGIQFQNLAQSHLQDLETARKLVLDNDLQRLENFGGARSALTELVRTALIPEKGKHFYIADFSAIEARVAAWLAGENWRLKAFEDGKDIYCASASKMFGVEVVKGGVNGHLRQKGKIAELALGYGGGKNALIVMGALEMGLAEDELQPLVSQWRNANKYICGFWHGLEDAARELLEGSISAVNLGKVKMKLRHGSILTITLPSGRDLNYRGCKLAPNLQAGGEGIYYDGLNAKGKWSQIPIYGGKFFENICQAVARDLLAEVLLEVKDEAVLHVHDEVVVEAEKCDTLLDLTKTPPTWAEGLPLNADGFKSDFYRK